LDLRLRYDLIGNLKERKETTENKFEKFYYDDLDRLKLMVKPNGGADENYLFDDAGRLTYKQNVGTYRYPKHTKAGQPFHGVVETELNGFKEKYQYDFNGNMILSPDEQFEYTSDNHVQLVYSDDRNWTSFEYGPDGSRFKEHSVVNNVTTETLYAGYFEKVTDYSSIGSARHPTKYRHYLLNKAGVFATVEIDKDIVLPEAEALTLEDITPAFHFQENKTVRYLLSDQLGSVMRVTDERGRIRGKFWYDPWGYRTSSWGLDRSWKRGFTGHEHLRPFSLIHMEGRVYNNHLATFLSVDSVNQMVVSTQAGNGYSYAHGNPLRYVDAKGNDFWSDLGNSAGSFFGDVWSGITHFGIEVNKWWVENWKTVVVVVAVVVVTYFTAGLGTVALESAIISGMAAGATAGALSAALYGGSFDDILGGAIKGAVIGAFTGAATAGIGEYFGGMAKAQGTLSASQQIESVAAHGLVGAGSESLRGGNFWSGFASGAAATAINSFGPKFDGVAANTAKAAVVGGTVAQISGDKFANGAFTAALTYALTPNTAGGPIKSQGIGGTAYVGGFFDYWGSNVVYDQYLQDPSPNKAYFSWDQGEALASWIDANRGDVEIIAHSYGADTAASVVAAGHAVVSLTTVDPVSWFRPSFSDVWMNSQTWTNYDATGGGWYRVPNLIAGVGGAWNSSPQAWADTYRPQPYDHATIMTKCGTPAGCQ
jgi:RHS repeat-associated protein